MNFFEAMNPIQKDVEVIFVADAFAEDYTGGAELTSEALIKSSPYKVQKLRSKEVTKSIVSQNKDKIWIFGNMLGMNPSVVPTIMGNCSYVILEYDYKFCSHRSPEKHRFLEGKECDCHKKQIGDVISSFFSGAQCIFWMSEKQQEMYRSRFPSLEDNDQFVLSSVFDEEFFMCMKVLREKYKDHVRKDWLIFKSNSWIKGTDAAIEYCKTNNLRYKEISNLPYEAMLEELAQAKGLVFLPPGGDTCPRMVIEAKLLGCDLVLNDNVQHAREVWFDTNDVDEVEQYLYAARDVFWNYVKNEIKEKVLNLSGYTTTYNCISQKYPFEQCIQSMLEFCDEVVVVDGGSTDGTWESLRDIQENLVPANKRLMLFDCDASRLACYNEHSPLKLTRIERDWNAPRFALFDGMQKAEARKLCTGDFCWQMDSDEIVHENDYVKIRDLIKNFPKGVSLVSLPVIEYWGDYDKVRLDVTPWKWRLSKNLPSITHGVPVTHRRLLDDGTMVATSGTDGCDMIHSRTGENIPFIGFYTGEAHEMRMAALAGNEQALRSYQDWIQKVVDTLPSVHHYSWFDIKRKIRTYKNYWTKHWMSLSGQSTEDTAENNMFFDAPWSEVTEQQMDEMAERLRNEMGGWIFHSKVDFSKRTPSMKLTTSPPKLMKKE